MPVGPGTCGSACAATGAWGRGSRRRSFPARPWLPRCWPDLPSRGSRARHPPPLTRAAGVCLALSGARPCVGSLARGGPTGTGTTNGFPHLHDASAARGWRAFRPPDPPLEPVDVVVHLRHPQRRPHPRPDPDRADAAPRAGGAARGRGQRRTRAVRRHQAAGAGAGGSGRQALRPVFRQPSLARRHADQLEDDLALDQAPARAGEPARRSGDAAGLHQEGAAQSQPRAATSSSGRWAASRTWAACPTSCS